MGMAVFSYSASSKVGRTRQREQTQCASKKTGRKLTQTSPMQYEVFRSVFEVFHIDCSFCKLKLDWTGVKK